MLPESLIEPVRRGRWQNPALMARRITDAPLTWHDLPKLKNASLAQEKRVLAVIRYRPGPKQFHLRVEGFLFLSPANRLIPVEHETPVILVPSLKVGKELAEFVVRQHRPVPEDAR